MARVAPWTDLEGHIGLWTACFPALQPLIRLASYQLGFRSTLNSTAKISRAPGASANAKHSQWTGSHSAKSQGYVSFYDDKDDSASGRVIVKGGSEGELNSFKDVEMYDLESGQRGKRGDNSSAVVIHKRTDVRVQIGEANERPKKWNAV